MDRNFIWFGLAGLWFMGCQSPHPLPLESGIDVQLAAVPLYDPARLTPEIAVVHMVLDYWTPPAPRRWWQRSTALPEWHLSQEEMQSLSPVFRDRLAERRLWSHWQEGRLQDLFERIHREVPPIVLLQPHPIDPARRYPALITGYDLGTQTLTLHGLNRRAVQMPINEFLIEWRHTYYLFLVILPPERATWALTDHERVGRGRFYRERGEWDAALADIRSAIGLQPEQSLLQVELGDTLWAYGDMSGAVSSYQRALHLEPNLARAANNLAWTFIAQGEAEPALSWARHAVSLEPDHPRYLHTLGWAQHQLGHNSNAIRNLQRAQAREARLTSAEKATMAVHLATVYQAERNPHLARQTLREALRNHPDLELPAALVPLLD